MEKKSVGTFLAQGAAGNVIATCAFVIAAVLYSPIGLIFDAMILLPIYLLAVGICGAGMGGVVCLSEWLLKRRLGIIMRSTIGITLATLIVVALRLYLESIVERRMLIESIVISLFLGLPAAALAGSRFNTIRVVVFGSSCEPANRDFGAGFSGPPGLLLRAGSLFGLLESLVYWACLVSSGSGNSHIRTAGEDFVMAIAAIVYFATVVFVSHWPPRKPLLIAMTVLVNAPLAIWTLNPHRPTGIESDLAAVVAWVFIFLWLLFAAGRMISVDNSPKLSLRRILPLTIWEIEIRHALNLW